jgi:5-methylcytosine-specific restriction endonuclease McrA
MGARTEPIVPALVFKRDDNNCWLCGRKTRGEVPALRAATLDHVIPLAKGGSHTYDNLRCACFECNSIIKRDQFVPYQLHLAAPAAA